MGAPHGFLVRRLFAFCALIFETPCDIIEETAANLLCVLPVSVQITIAGTVF